MVFEELEREPRVARRLIAGLSRRLHYLVSEIESQSMRFGTQRVVGYLMDECASSVREETLVITLPMTKSAVASRADRGERPLRACQGRRKAARFRQVILV
jgi:hypothetical protein